MEKWRLGHRPALDGLRGVAVLMVIAAHYGIPRVNSTSAGTAGVTAFFTLSGFLITALLLQEHTARASINRRAFYRRRALRLAPALAVCVALAITLELATTGHITDWDMIVGSLTYTTDFVMIDGHWGANTFLGHTWSLAIEEQFYLLWPFALIFLTRLNKTKTIVVLTYASGIAIVLRHLMWNDGAGKVRLWSGPDTRSDAILIGCLLAFTLHGTMARTTSRRWTIGGGILLATTIPWATNLNQENVAVITPLTAAVATAAIIYGIANQAPSPILGSAVLRWVGTRSYGLYLYHVPIGLAVSHWTAGGMFTAWTIAAPLAFGAAELSWRYVEQPFLRRKDQETVTVAMPAASNVTVKVPAVVETSAPKSMKQISGFVADVPGVES